MSQKRHVKNVLPFNVFPKGRIGSSLTRSCILRSVWELSWIVWRHLAVSVECMFVSLGFWVSVIFWDARADWGCSRVFLETLFMKDSVRLELTHQLGPTLKGKILFTWRFWDIKISKPSTTSKNDWVLPFFLFFMSVREMLQFTVSLDHPVAFQTFKHWRHF